MILSLADRYLCQAQPAAGRMVSGDQMPDGAGGGLVYPNVVPGYYGGTVASAGRPDHVNVVSTGDVNVPS
jgi:hypothetical protein